MVYEIIKEQCEIRAKDYAVDSLRKWGLEVRSQTLICNFFILDVVWIILAMFLAICAVIFSPVLHWQGVLGCAVPGILWGLSAVKPFSFIRHKIAYKNYSIAASLKGKYK